MPEAPTHDDPTQVEANAASAMRDLDVCTDELICPYHQRMVGEKGGRSISPSQKVWRARNLAEIMLRLQQFGSREKPPAYAGGISGFAV